MATFPLSIMTPERVVFDAEVDMAIVRTTQGDVGILKGHIDYVASIEVGAVKLKIGEETKTAAVFSGLLKVNNENAVILVQTCEWADEIDLERAKIAEKKAREKIDESLKLSKTEFIIAELKLKRAINRINISGSK